MVREGTDLTIVSWSRMVSVALEAAARLEEEKGVRAEVIDLRWLAPLDFAAVHASVAKTGRLVVAHEANLTGGFGAEIVARAASECFSDLKARVERVGAPDTPVPAAPALQDVTIPNIDDVVQAARRVLA